MRPEIKAYHFDWMLWATLEHASKAADGTPGELAHLYRYIPYYKGILDPVLREGEPGIVFLKCINRYLRNIINARREGKKVAATTFCFLPGLFYALDVVPVTLEILSALGGLMWQRGMYDYLDYACEVGFTETSCSSQRGALGAYLAGLGEKIDFIICDTPGVCDTNANAYAFASEYLDVPFYYLNYPQVIGDDRSQQYHADDYKALIAFVEAQSGNTLQEDRLRAILEEADKQDRLIADLEDMHSLVPTPLPHPFTGMLNGGLEATVKIEGQAAAVVGSTADNQPAHIPTPPGTSTRPRTRSPSKTVPTSPSPASCFASTPPPPRSRVTARVRRSCRWARKT